LTEREDFLVQSQERSGGIVVYTGMNNNGDSFIGNRKTSSSTGEEVTFDNPIPTITGEDPSRLSAVFDEVTVKERLVVEGGNSGTVLSQFDGPVSFNKEVRFRGNLTLGANSTFKVNNQLPASIGGNLVVGNGITVDGNASISGISTLSGQVIVNTGIIPDTDEGAYLGSSTRPFSEAWVGEIAIATGTTDSEDRTIRAVTGNLTLAATTGNSVAISTSASVAGNLNVTGTISAEFLDVPNVAPIGSVVMWTSASSPPTNWRFCNGTQLSQTTYSELFALIGTTYNTGGETAGNFRVPNLGNRFVVGTGPSYGLNATGGAATVALQEAQLPSHTHTYTMDSAGLHDHGGTNQDGGHDHTIEQAGGHSHGGATNPGGQHSHGGQGTGDGGSHSHGMPNSGPHSHSSPSHPNNTEPTSNGGQSSRQGSTTITISGGSHNHPIDVAPDHKHPIPVEPNHNHPITEELQHIHTAVAAPQHTHPITQDASHNHGLTIDPAGSSGAHENLPPYRSLYYIIRII
jgi:microcystin-dependent protein